MERIAAALVPPPQAGQDTQATKAATTKYAYKRIELEQSKGTTATATATATAAAAAAAAAAGTTNVTQFTMKHCMLLYKKLLAQGLWES